MSETISYLLDVPLIPDPDALEELGPPEVKAIADEDWRGSRLLIAQAGAQPITPGDQPGGAVELICTFQPAHNCRFVWARLLLNLTNPPGICILDLAPRTVREHEPVKFTIDDKGSLSVTYLGIEAGVGADVRTEYAIYHCSVQGSGAGTALARWDFSEDPTIRNGIGREQSLVLTLPVTGVIAGSITISARLARPGLAGGLDAIMDLILGPTERGYPVAFTIPNTPPPTDKGWRRFLPTLE